MKLEAIIVAIMKVETKIFLQMSDGIRRAFLLKTILHFRHLATLTAMLLCNSYKAYFVGKKERL